MDWTHNTIKFDQLPQDHFRNFNWKEETLNGADFSRLQYLITWYHKSPDGSLKNLPAASSLRYLEMNWSNAGSFVGIDAFSDLKRLEMHYCTKLESAAGMESLGDGLEFLHLNHCKKFSVTPALLNLTALRVLRLNACGDIESLGFLKSFRNLTDFRFVNTNILDGNLLPILEHPTIESVGFLNKRHYNLSADDMKDQLTNKRTRRRS